jgi:transposase
MGMKIIDADYTERYLLPPCIEDWVGRDHPARFIREMVEQIELSDIGVKEQQPVEGRPPYANELLLRIWLYGYWKRIRSSRKLEEACREDIGFLWLCGQKSPDHNTLWRFFNVNRKALKELFKKTVKLALKMDLVGLVLQAVDGTKIQALCSGWERHRIEDVEKLEETLNEEIAALEKQIEETNRQEITVQGRLPKELESREVLRERVREALNTAREEGRRHIHIREPEAHRMECNSGNRFGYNAQTVVDSKNQIIVAQETVTDENDLNQLTAMLEQAKDNTQKAVLSVADAGYSSGAELEKASGKRMEVLVNLAPNQKVDGQHEYHSTQFKYDKERDVMVCPQGKELPFQRLRYKRGKEIRVYRSAKVCKCCPVRCQCTTDRHGRTIDIGPGYTQLRDMNEKLKDETNKALLARRRCIVEPVFAQIKAHGQFYRWTYKGIENVRAQWSLLCSVWNLKVIYRHWKAEMSSGSPCAGNGKSFIGWHEAIGQLIAA